MLKSVNMKLSSHPIQHGIEIGSTDPLALSKYPASWASIES